MSATQKLNVNQHKKNFIKEFNSFLCFLKSVVDTKEINTLLKNYSHLNFEKLAVYCYDKAVSDKPAIFTHDKDLFVESKFYIPSIDFSIYFNAMTPDQINTFWNKFVRIYVYCQILSGNTTKDVEISVQNMIEEVKNDQLKEDSFGFLDSFIDGNVINEKIKELGENDLTEYTDKILNIFGKSNNVDFKESLEGIVKEFITELKETDFTKQPISESFGNIANKIAQRITSEEKGDKFDKIMDMTKDFITSVKSGDILEKITKNMGEDEKNIVGMASDIIKNVDIESGDINKIINNIGEYATKNGGLDLNKLKKKYKIDDKKMKDIMSNPKNYGLSKEQMTSVNRKIKRKMEKETKKQRKNEI